MNHNFVPLLTLCLFSVNIMCYPQLNGRIVGGKNANIEELPYQVSLTNLGEHICGGSILNKNTIVTAAHCVYGQQQKYLSINAGTTWANAGGQRSSVGSLVIHRKYDNITSDFDIAILRLSTNLTYDKAVQPIPLPKENESVPTGTIAVVSGWGFDKEDGRLSQILKKVEVPIYDQIRCRTLYLFKGTVTPRMLCAGYARGRFDACQGDSGGPLVANGKLVGIVSWGYGCARPRYPGVYTKVSKFIKWIIKQL